MRTIDFTCPMCERGSYPEIDDRDPDPLVTCPTPKCGFSMRLSQDAKMSREKAKWGSLA
jgi:hypothetical protein